MSVERFDQGTKYLFRWDEGIPDLNEVEDALIRCRVVGAVGDEKVNFHEIGGFSVTIASEDLLHKPAPKLIRKHNALIMTWVALIAGCIIGMYLGWVIWG